MDRERSRRVPPGKWPVSESRGWGATARTAAWWTLNPRVKEERIAPDERPEAALTRSVLRTSPAHAVVAALRVPTNEAQLTRVVGALGHTDPAFASAFVSAVLALASRNAQYAEAVAALGVVPDELECHAEHTVYDRDDWTLGRVDLRFDGEDFTLLIENKLHSGFGPEQLERYREALQLLPADRRAALVAVTRDVPSIGELTPGTQNWLGAVRWSKLLPALRQLPITDPDAARDWHLLLDILDVQGDLGVTRVDKNLISAWARYRDGREQLVALLDDIRQRSLDIARQELHAKYKRFARQENLCGAYTRGKSQSAVRREQETV